MDIGTLDRRVRIESKTSTPDSVYGTPVPSWSTVATVWANVQEVLPSKSESTSDDIRIAERPARVRIRYLTGLNSDMRLIYLDRSDRVMRILTPPVEIGRKEGIEFMVADWSTAGTA